MQLYLVSKIKCLVFVEFKNTLVKQVQTWIKETTLYIIVYLVCYLNTACINDTTYFRILIMIMIKASRWIV